MKGIRTESAAVANYSAVSTNRAAGSTQLAWKALAPTRSFDWRVHSGVLQQRRGICAVLAAGETRYETTNDDRPTYRRETPSHNS